MPEGRELHHGDHFPERSDQQSDKSIVYCPVWSAKERRGYALADEVEVQLVKSNAVSATAWYLLLALVGLVLIQSFRELITSVYYFSLVEMGPTLEICAVLVIFAPLSAIPLTRLLGWRGGLIVSGAFTALARFPMGLGLGEPFQLVFSALSFSGASTFLIVALSVQRRERTFDPEVYSSQGAAGALSLSVLVQLTLLAAGRGLDVSIVPEAAGLLLSPSLSAFGTGSIGFLLYMIYRSPVLDARRTSGGAVGDTITGGAVDSRAPFFGLGAFLALEALILPYPEVSSLWLGEGAAASFSMAMLSTSLFILSLFTTWKPLLGLRISFAPPKGSILANVLLVAAAANLFLVRFPVPIAPLGITWLCLIDLWLVLDAILDTEPFAGEQILIDAEEGKKKYIGLRAKRGKGRNPDVLARRMVYSTAMMLVFPVLVVLSLNHPFLPGGSFLEGGIPVIMFIPSVLLAITGFLCSKKGIYEPALQEGVRTIPGKGSPALAAGSGSGHLVRGGPAKRRLGAEWISIGSITAILVIAGTAFVYANERPQDSFTTESPASITVMTYNLHQGFNNDGRADPVPMLCAIKDADPDIIFLQETEAVLPSGGNYDLTGYIAGEMDMGLVRGPSPGRGTYGLSIVSRFPLSDPEVHMLTSKVEQKYYLACLADLGGRSVTLVNVHLGQDEEDRPIQTIELAGALRNISGPIIVAGDFNAEPDDPLMERFNSTVFGNGTRNASDLGLISGWHGSPDKDPAGEAHTWPASDLPDEKAMIDYILTSPVLEPTRATIDTRKDASDHRPLVVELDVSRSGG
jgi:endonuclease/exonuclease/phosphatase family metal-dependent hydrolase